MKLDFYGERMTNVKEYISLKTPFLLICEDDKEERSTFWLKTEEELIEIATEMKSYGCRIIDAMEIASCRPLEELVI